MIGYEISVDLNDEQRRRLVGVRKMNKLNGIYGAARGLVCVCLVVGNHVCKCSVLVAIVKRMKRKNNNLRAQRTVNVNLY